MSGAIAERLYPPTIPSSLPAFYAENGTATIAVPFSMNRGVDDSLVEGLVLKIKTVQSNVYLKSLFLSKQDAKLSISHREAKFKWPDINTDKIFNNIKLGQYIKVQMAYIDGNGVTGYFSTVGVVKYTSKPSVYIKNAVAEDANCIPVFKQTYLGVYETSEDKSERPYSYCFSLYNSKRGLVETSGWLLHNSSINTELSETAQIEKTMDQYTFQSTLEQYVQYFIQYGVRTMNNLEVYSPLYPIIEVDTQASGLKVDLVATNNYDNGYVEIGFKMQAGESIEQNLPNNDPISMQIERAIEVQGLDQYGALAKKYETWEPLKHKYFTTYQDIVNFKFLDFAVEQGMTYKYCYRLYNENLIQSNRTPDPDLPNEDATVKVDFEDMFLWDGQRQLCIKFNPKVTSFKTNILEQKVETIGNRYPMFSRNGLVNYKEFPISGLISYSSDDNMLFLDQKADLGLSFIDEPVRSAAFNNFDGYEPVYVPISGEYQEDETYYLLFTDYEGVPILDEYGNYQYTPSVPNDSSRGILQEQWTAWADKLFTQKLVPATKAVDPIPSEANTMRDIFRAERLFKLSALEWLNNGQIKMFKSPAEGNYLVRLMNVSLSPEDKLGRRLHSFNSTAYEVEELNYTNLVSLGFISLTEQESELSNRASVNIYQAIAPYINSSNIQNGVSIKLNNQDIFGSLAIEASTDVNSSSFYLRIGEDVEANRVLISRDLEINPGSNAALPDVWFNFKDNEDFANGNWRGLLGDAILTYEYYNTIILYGEFNNIKNVEVRNTISTFVGYGADGVTINFGTQLSDSWSHGENILRFFVLEFEEKPAVNHLYLRNNDTHFYIDSACTVEQTSFNPTEMYQVRIKATLGNDRIRLFIPKEDGTMDIGDEAKTLITNSPEAVYPMESPAGTEEWYKPEDIQKLFAGQTLFSLTDKYNHTVSFTQIPNISVSDTTEYVQINIHERVYLKAAYQSLIVTYKTNENENDNSGGD